MREREIEDERGGGRNCEEGGRERGKWEKEKERDGERTYFTAKNDSSHRSHRSIAVFDHYYTSYRRERERECVCMCVCVYVKERESARARARAR